MAELDLYSYLLRDVKHMEKTQDGVTCVFSKDRNDFDEIGFDITDLPERIPLKSTFP